VDLPSRFTRAKNDPVFKVSEL
jgi:hypothetical protein